MAGVQVLRGSDQKANILAEFHSGTIGRHSGVNKTIDAVKIHYWWPALTDDIKEYVSL